ncbi:UNVERIFIED_CONTAM: hypothetical protein FKN15_076586 [Acipenser sinensis]
MGTRSVQTALSLTLILLVQLHGAFGRNWPDQPVYNPVLFTAPRAVFQAKPTSLSVQRADLSLFNSVSLDCRKDAMVVTVNRDLFGIGYLVNSADLSVGSAGCSATSSDSVANTVLFSIQLQDCGSTFQVFPDFLSYTNHLYYKPASVGIITRVNMADILLECRYPRPALNKLRFDITAFKFQGDSRSMIYMTCTLRAVHADKPADASNKACSYQKQTYRPSLPKQAIPASPVLMSICGMNFAIANGIPGSLPLAQLQLSSEYKLCHTPSDSLSLE